MTMNVALRLQPRDIEFLRYLAYRGLADAPTAKDAVFSTCGERAFRRRMAMLSTAGFVHRLSIGEYFANSGRQPYVYSLSEKGADVLRSEEGVTDPRVLGEVSPSFVAHQLGVCKFLDRIEESAKVIGIDCPPWRLEYDLTE